jgi:hypothetical protein
MELKEPEFLDEKTPELTGAKVNYCEKESTFAVDDVLNNTTNKEECQGGDDDKIFERHKL